MRPHLVLTKFVMQQLIFSSHVPQIFNGQRFFPRALRQVTGSGLHLGFDQAQSIQGRGGVARVICQLTVLVADTLLKLIDVPLHITPLLLQLLRFLSQPRQPRASHVSRMLQGVLVGLKVCDGLPERLGLGLELLQACAYGLGALLRLDETLLFLLQFFQSLCDLLLLRLPLRLQGVATRVERGLTCLQFLQSLGSCCFQPLNFLQLLPDSCHFCLCHSGDFFGLRRLCLVCLECF
mmetsp:Transcript_1449/g.3288  ORF Transcript_1449/g.3288 Transcript_1449/m.3288 type:complete len:236 (+) Transcript_1449:820-1527(+)